jgi:hypothetical protein
MKMTGSKYSVKLHRSFIKHTPQAHNFKVIELCSVDTLNERERFYQEKHNSTSSKNLNCILTKTESKRGVGIRISDKQKKQIGDFHRGKVCSEETRKKIRIARAKQVITDDHKRKISENSGAARLVLNLSTGIFYPSAKQASVAHGIRHNYLVCSLIGRHKNKTDFTYV